MQQHLHGLFPENAVWSQANLPLVLPYIVHQLCAKLIVGPMSGWLVAEYTPDGVGTGVENHPSHYMVWVWIGGMAAITPIILITMYKLFRHAEQQDIEAATEGGAGAEDDGD